jgi:hypothetical protein
MAVAIYEEHFRSELFVNRFDVFEQQPINDDQLTKIIRELNRSYDELVLTNCIIDERIFLDQGEQLNDWCNAFNENRNEKAFVHRTPLTANEHLQIFCQPCDELPAAKISHGLTPISQAKQLIDQLHSIIGHEQTGKPSKVLEDLLREQTFLGEESTLLVRLSAHVSLAFQMT